MKTRLLSVALLAAAAACGGGARPSATSTPSPSPTATDTTTTSPSPTGSPSIDPATLQFATSVEGEYRGRWTNTTYGSTGNARMRLDVDETAGFLLAEVDVDGGVFGGADPPLETMKGTLGVLGIEFSVNLASFGSLTATIDTDGTVSARVEQPPSDRIDLIEAAGTLTTSGLNLTYTVTFSDGTTAEGTFVLNRA